MVPKKEYETEPTGEPTVQSATGRLTEQTEELVESIGQRLRPRGKRPDTLQRTKKIVAEALKTVTEGIETSTDYFTGRGMVEVVRDMETLIRRYPFQALILGGSVGYLLSRSRQRRRVDLRKK